MKNLGIVRKLDALGRITLPSELRRTLGVEDRGELEIYVEDNKVILEKYNAVPTCQVCGSQHNVKQSADGKVSICCDCAKIALNMFGE